MKARIQTGLQESDPETVRFLTRLRFANFTAACFQIAGAISLSISTIWEKGHIELPFLIVLLVSFKHTSTKGLTQIGLYDCKLIEPFGTLLGKYQT